MLANNDMIYKKVNEDGHFKQKESIHIFKQVDTRMIDTDNWQFPNDGHLHHVY